MLPKKSLNTLILHKNESIYILEGLIIQWKEWTRPVSLPWVLPGGQLHHLPLPLPLPSYSTPHPPLPPLGEALPPLFTQWHTPSPPCVGPCILHLQGVHSIKKCKIEFKSHHLQDFPYCPPTVPFPSPPLFFKTTPPLVLEYSVQIIQKSQCTLCSNGLM